jgi:hypothetical protein
MPTSVQRLGTLVAKGAHRKEAGQEGGWSIFGTGWTGVETLDPSADLPLAANGDAAWFGWPSDEKLEALRSQWLKATALDERKKQAAAIQERAFEVVPYLPTGQWKPMTAYHKNLKGPSSPRHCSCGTSRRPEAVGGKPAVHRARQWERGPPNARTSPSAR